MHKVTAASFLLFAVILVVSFNYSEAGSHVQKETLLQAVAELVDKLPAVGDPLYDLVTGLDAILTPVLAGV